MKRQIHKLAALLLAGLLLVSLGACSRTSPAPSPQTQDTPAAAPQAQEPERPLQSTEAPPTTGAQEDAPSSEAAAEPAEEGRSVLVVYFSETGTTRGVAEKIAALTDADLYEITPAQEYTDADLNWNDKNSRTTLEQNDGSIRPEIGSDPIRLDGYTTIYIGFPIWWGEEPRILDTFVEGYDFTGITMIPFCTSGSSGIGRSGQNLAENAGSGSWLDGKRFGAGVSETELQAWIDGLK